MGAMITGFANRRISAKLPIRKMSAQATEKVLVAMSGGVDSSVAALLLNHAGVPIEGAYMKNWINEENIVGNCPWQTDIEDARAVAVVAFDVKDGHTHPGFGARSVGRWYASTPTSRR
jgi:hypothetical protein